MSGLQIHGRVQVDITDDDHIHYTTKYSYKFEKCWQKVSKKGNRRLLLRSGATCIVPGLTLNFVARISVGSLHDLWWASKYFANQNYL